MGWPKRAKKPRFKPSGYDLAWVAGFLEGEGSFVAMNYTHRSKPGHGSGRGRNYPTHVKTSGVQVTSKDPWPLRRLLAMFGGSVFQYQGTTTFRPGEERWFHGYRAYGPRARDIMRRVYQRMSPRRKKQIRKALGH